MFLIDMVSATEKRKKQHLELCAKKDVSFEKKTTLLECVELNYKTLPQIKMEDVNLSTDFLGKKFDFPVIVSAITGGAQVAKKVNLDVARACQSLGIGMGLGSMRAMIEQPSLAETYRVRAVAPDIFLAGNIGMFQLKQYSPQQIQEALNVVEADAVAVHVNAAQEVVQPEGDTDAEGLIETIDAFSREISVPVYVKEVGHGISFEVAKALSRTNIKAIDVQGAGGTSWTRVDSLRHKNGFGEIFRDIGLPTAVSIIETKNAILETDKKIVGSGGVYNGLDAVKSILLGADMVGMALPILKSQIKGGAKGIENYLLNYRQEMLIASYLTGCKSIEELNKEEYVVLGKLKEWLNQ
jgi:isopentenyl-diphosphate delta-isomerase